MSNQPMPVTPSNVGAHCLSEDDCISQGISFASYERGVNDAADAFDKNPRASEDENYALKFRNEYLQRQISALGLTDWHMIPRLGTRVSADHPITSLNPEPVFVVDQLRMDETGRVSARGDNTCWFGTSGLFPPKTEAEGEPSELPTKVKATKVVIVTGQDCLNEVNALAPVREGKALLVKFPEFDGPQACIDRLANALFSHEHVVVMTRFEQAINFMGAVIDTKAIGYDQVQIILWIEGERSEHGFCEEGYITGTWPYGCLYGDHDKHLYRFKNAAKGKTDATND